MNLGFEHRLPDLEMVNHLTEKVQQLCSTRAATQTNTLITQKKWCFAGKTANSPSSGPHLLAMYSPTNNEVGKEANSETYRALSEQRFGRE